MLEAKAWIRGKGIRRVTEFAMDVFSFRLLDNNQIDHLPTDIFQNLAIIGTL